MAHTIDIDGTESEVKPKNGSDFKLDEIYKLLGVSIIEIVATNDDRIMVIDEEGKLNGALINPKATSLYFFNENGHIEDVIMGKVLVCERDQVL